MQKNAFAFLRATYFRWARTIESVCPELAAAPVVACVGDIHVENFGTWRDADGRLVWGVNDYDEAAFMPYAFDLVRLATSACLSPPGKKGDAARIVAAVLDGYRSALADPRAVLLDQHASGCERSPIRPSGPASTSGAMSMNVPTRIAPRRPRRARAQPSRRRHEGPVRIADEGPRQPGPATLPRDRRMERRTGGARGEGVSRRRGSGPIARRRRASPGSSTSLGVVRSPDSFSRAQAGFVIRRVAPDAPKIGLGGCRRASAITAISARWAPTWRQCMPPTRDRRGSSPTSTRGPGRGCPGGEGSPRTHRAGLRGLVRAATAARRRRVVTAHVRPRRRTSSRCRSRRSFALIRDEL